MWIGLFPCNNAMRSIILLHLLFTKCTLLIWDNTTVFIFRMNHTRAAALSPWAVWALTLRGISELVEIQVFKQVPCLYTSSLYLRSSHPYFGVTFDWCLFLQTICILIVTFWYWNLQQQLCNFTGIDISYWNLVLWQPSKYIRAAQAAAFLLFIGTIMPLKLIKQVVKCLKPQRRKSRFFEDLDDWETSQIRGPRWYRISCLGIVSETTSCLYGTPSICWIGATALF